MNDSQQSSARPEALLGLVTRLFGDFAKLAGQELALAGVEIKRKLTSIAIAIGLLIVAAFVGIAILATLTATLILAFALVVAPWLAALIVTAIYAFTAIVLALVARSLIARALPPIPQQTLATAKENIAWAKRLMTSNSR